jgi:hypothetical protein
VTGFPVQRLRFLPGYFVIEHRADADPSTVEAPWLALIRAPEGLTVIREVADAPSEGCWSALYGDDPHGLDLPGMLAAVVAPLGAASVPVFVTSTYHADLVLVPTERRVDAMSALEGAGHRVVGPS